MGSSLVEVEGCFKGVIFNGEKKLSVQVQQTSSQNRFKVGTGSMYILVMDEMISHNALHVEKIKHVVHNNVNVTSSLIKKIWVVKSKQCMCKFNSCEGGINESKVYILLAVHLKWNVDRFHLLIYIILRVVQY